MQQRNLGAQILGHGGALRLVLGIKTIAEGSPWRIKYHNDLIAGIILEQSPQHVGYPEYRPGRQMVRCPQVRERMKGAVQKTGGVNENTRVLGHDLGLVSEFPS